MILYIDSESELRKIGSQAKKFVLKDFAGKFGALFFIGFGYKIDAPIYRRLGGESNREIVSFRCVRAGEAKLRERVRASVSLFARLENRISLAGPCPVCPRRCLFFCGLSGTSRLIRTSRSFCACPF